MTRKRVLQRSTRILVGCVLLQVASSMCAQDIAPPSPEKQWNPSQLPTAEKELAQRTRLYPNVPVATLDPAKVYTLPELIDIAESNNPQTRSAWESARSKAAGVGLSKSLYYPLLAATASTEFSRMFIPFPQLVVNKQALQSALGGLSGGAGGGTGGGSSSDGGAIVSIDGGSSLVSKTSTSEAELSVEWLLFDFGLRDAQVAQSRAQLLGANMDFNKTHQQIVYNVTESFYKYNAAREKLVAQQTSRRSSALVLRATKTKLALGLAKLNDELRAEQQDAEAELDVLKARANLDDGLVTLINGLGVPPTAALQVAGMPNLRLSSQLVPALDALIDRALSHRPDLLSSLADLRAARAGVRKVRAEYYPTITFSGDGEYANLDSSSGGGPYIDARDYEYSATLKVTWLLFDGFARDNQMRDAKAKLRSAESKLAQSRDDAVKEVWQDYTDLKSSFEQRDASARSLKAAEAAFDVTFRYYEQGLSTYPDVVDAEKSVASSRSNDVEIRTQLFTRAAALAHSVGDIDRLAPPARTPLPPKLPQASPSPAAKPSPSPAARPKGTPKK